ncbi:hypothetical protein E3T26_03135 [Cryobacterium sp. TMT1-21]|nr:hypothetical protein E3T26_03135 [Cryobacterium sp. TMT1-21]
MRKCPGAYVPRCRGAPMPRCRGAAMPRCRDARRPNDRRRVWLIQEKSAGRRTSAPKQCGGTCDSARIS